MKQFFYPKSIAVIGVADHPANLAKNIIQNLMTFHYEGAVYAVGRENGTVFEKPIYGTVLEIPEDIDLATVLVPAGDVPEVAENCGQKGIHRMVIGSAGFSEVAPEREALDQKLRRICRKYGIRVVGPNCMGLENTDNGLCLPFTSELPETWKQGPLGIISQSGTVAMDCAPVALPLKQSAPVRWPVLETNLPWMKWIS